MGPPKPIPRGAGGSASSKLTAFSAGRSVGGAGLSNAGSGGAFSLSERPALAGAVISGEFPMSLVSALHACWF